MQTKQISLKDIDFTQKAKDDLPYLKEKALEYLNKYANATSMADKKYYICLHFQYMDWYHGTLDMLNDGCSSNDLLDHFEKQMFAALQSGNLKIVDRLIAHWTAFVKNLNGGK
jgi:hypothetical protein